jgi:hypothetical protein
MVFGNLGAWQGWTNKMNFMLSGTRISFASEKNKE